MKPLDHFKVRRLKPRRGRHLRRRLYFEVQLVQQPRFRPRVAQQLRDERRQPPCQRLRDPKDGTSERHFRCLSKAAVRGLRSDLVVRAVLVEERVVFGADGRLMPPPPVRSNSQPVCLFCTESREWSIQGHRQMIICSGGDLGGLAVPHPRALRGLFALRLRLSLSCLRYVH